ncbi:MAG: CoA ester lyase [Hyphomicrobiales bacterium]|nr:CoA ester lyase [Hyphomicrobiales bacterium]
MQPNRTFIFAPGNHARKVEKVFGTGADAVILDLEDAVAVAEKEATRARIVAALQGPRRCRGYVRVNDITTEFCFGDLEAVVGPGLDGVVLPKVESAADVTMIDWVVGNLERKAGMTVGAIDLIPIIETGRGLAAAREICGAGGRLKRVSFGAGDYTRDMGMDWTLEETELASAQAEIVLASRISELEPPLDTVFIHIREHDHFKRSAERGRRLGFQGKLCIHPDQVPIANAAFAPTEEETAWARRIVESFAEAEAAGSASIQVDGYFVDYPIVVKARRIVDLAEAVAAQEAERAG